jgi:hypothetical protein
MQSGGNAGVLKKNQLVKLLQKWHQSTPLIIAQKKEVTPAVPPQP